MRRLQGLAALAAAVVSCALGAGVLWPPARPQPREPAWAAAVAPVARAPIPRWAVVGLAAPAGTAPEDAGRLLSEAVVRRPDLRWGLVEELGAASRPDAIVSVGDAHVPPGWRAVWRLGVVAVWTPAGS